LQQGRAAEHDSLIAAVAAEYRKCDALVLGQFSMARAASGIPAAARPQGVHEPAVGGQPPEADIRRLIEMRAGRPGTLLQQGFEFRNALSETFHLSHPIWDALSETPVR
jgi:hypothetical protein